MKSLKNLFLFFILVFSLQNAKSQDIAHPKGTIAIDAYYGAPNLTNLIFKVWIFGLNSTYSNTITNQKYGSIGPFGVRGEYFILKNLGLGLDLNYSNSWVDFTYKHHDETLLDYLPENYKIEIPRIGVIPRISWHFISKSKYVDGYLVGGLGYRNYNVKISTSDYYKRLGFNKNIPSVATRLGIGFRFFVNPNLGFNVEAGIGGALITGGLSLKFNTKSQNTETVKH